VQASLLDALDQHDITLEPPPNDVILRPGLVKITITRTDSSGEVMRFGLPVQWEEGEAGELIQVIRGLTWQLNDKGVPIDFDTIIEICDQYLFAKVGFVESISYKWRAKNET
jgi:hypothetical protein